MYKQKFQVGEIVEYFVFGCRYDGNVEIVSVTGNCITGYKYEYYHKKTQSISIAEKGELYKVGEIKTL